MSAPRCGAKDVHRAADTISGTARVMSGGKKRHKRYILLKKKWQREREIDVQFNNYTTDMPVEEQEAVISYVVDVSMLMIVLSGTL